MLCISAKITNENHINIDSQIVSAIKNNIRPDLPIAIFDRNISQILIATIKKIQSNQAGEIRITYNTDSKTIIAADIHNILFAKSQYIFQDDDFATKLLKVNTALNLPPLILQIKKIGDNLRMIFVDGHNSIFSENEITAKQWQEIKKDVDDFVNEVNLCVKSGRAISDGLKDKARQIIRQTFEVLRIDGENPRRLDVLYTGVDIYLPFEFIDNSYFVRHLISTQKKVSDRKEKSINKFTLVYSSNLQYALNEVQNLTQILKSQFALEVFSEENYPDYKSGLNQSNIFHFVGHGKIEDNLAKIMLNNNLIDSLDYCKNLCMSVLNCCSVGKTTRGIIGSILTNSGLADSIVIASPFEIPDKNNYDFAKFYRFYDSKNPQLSSYLASIIDTDYAMFYRQYGVYDGDG